MADAEYINRTTDIMALIGTNTTLKRVANTNHGEYCGPCPFCGGDDRFRVQPKNATGGRWWCRGCGGEKWHSAIDYIMRRDGIDFLAALNLLSGEGVIPQPVKNKMDIQKERPKTDDRNIGKWQEGARDLLESSIAKMWDPMGERAREYLHGRGLTDETIKKWHLGYLPRKKNMLPERWGFPREKRVTVHNGILIPCFVDGHGQGDIKYLKIRKPKGGYIQVVGSGHWLFGGFTFESAAYAFLFESELDVLLAEQTGLQLGYASLPAGQPLRQEYFKYFEPIDNLIIAMDNDTEGAKAAENLSRANKHFHIAGDLPDGKDLTEYYQTTQNQADVINWLYSQLDLIGVIA